MILNTGSRTDIPAFYSEWFANRLREGFVCARNPFRPELVTRYRLDPQVVDLVVFCTKNPAPMLTHMDLLAPYRQFWFVTITPYGPEIEPGVPDKLRVMESFRRLSEIVSPRCMGWRYDPIFVDETYTVQEHIRRFERMAGFLEGSVSHVVISFVDMYEKTKKNFPSLRPVRRAERQELMAAMADIGARRGMRLSACLEGEEPAAYGIDTGGCMSRAVLERALGEELLIPAGLAPAREGCRCLLGSDIGAYNSCAHFCRYCYANYDREAVERNRALHDPASPLLIGHLQPEDIVRDARQSSWLTGQLKLEL